MATRASRRKQREDTLLSGWQSMPERAPSVLRQDVPTAARVVGLVSVLLVAMGGFARIIPALQIERFRYFIGPGTGFLLLSLGVCGLLYHAARDHDPQYRRTYGLLGLMLLALAAGTLILRLLRVEGPWGQLFLPYGVPLLGLGLAFLLAVGRQETDSFWRPLVVRVIGGVGALLIAVGLVGGLLGREFLVGEGILLLLLGLFYVLAFIGMNGADSVVGYRTGLALGAVGGLAVAAAVVRSVIAGAGATAATEAYLVPYGLLLIGLGLLYVLVAVGICSDVPLVVLTRRELAAFFYSPIAYLVMLGTMLVGWFMFWQFVGQLLREPVWEPIIARYVLALFPVITIIFVVPVLTMRLLSEEKRTGTLEVLLTAPVNEWAVVLSKFVAALIFYVIALLPWGLFLISLRVYGGEPFDYRPVLSFFIALVITGAGFLSVGLFFSAITRNQIIAAVFTFVAMIGFTAAHLIQDIARLGQAWSEVLRYISYIELWFLSLNGIVAPRFYLFHVSLAVFFLFLTTKVLEARRWS